MPAGSFDAAAQAMVDTSSRDTFRDRTLLGKLCDSPQKFLVDIRKVHEMQFYQTVWHLAATGHKGSAQFRH